MSDPKANPWRCAGCGSAADGLIKTCKCPTMVGRREDGDGRLEGKWLVTREDDERQRLTDAAPEMLATLKRAHQTLTAMGDYPSMREDIEGAISKAERAGQ